MSCCSSCLTNDSVVDTIFGVNPEDLLEDLELRPSEIDNKLERDVKSWETAINTYRDYELEVLDSVQGDKHKERREMLYSIISSLRSEPKLYISFKDDDVQQLAKLRLDIFHYQDVLQLSQPIADSSERDGEMDNNPLHMTIKDETPYAEPSGKITDGHYYNSHRYVPPDPLISVSRNALQEWGKTNDDANNVDDNHLSTFPSPIPMSHETPEKSRDTMGNKELNNRDMLMTPSNNSDRLRPRSTLRQSLTTPGASRRGINSANLHSPDIALNAAEEEVLSVQKRLSKNWAARLNRVDATQGTLIPMPVEKSDSNNQQTASAIPIAVTEKKEASEIIENAAITGGTDSARSEQLSRVKPKWPHFLQEVWYDVVKWNDYGAKQRRIIRLTEYCILNVRRRNGADKVSKLYNYLSIRHIWMENSNTLKIEMKNGNVICYLSNIAATIVQQITTRVQARIALERTTFSLPVNSDLNFSQDAAFKLIEAIEMEQEEEANSLMQSFAQSLAEKIKPAANVDCTPGSAVRNLEPVTKERSNTNTTMNSTMTKSTLFSYPIQSGASSIQSKLHEIVFDIDTTEGSTRQHFIDNFKKDGKGCNDMRKFIDGFHEYILSSRGMELAMVYLEAEGEVGDGRKTIDSNAKEKDKLTTFPRGRKSIRGISKFDTLAAIDEQILAKISFVTYEVVEESCYLPLKDHLIQLLPASSSEDDDKLLQKINTFRGRSQLEWNVEEAFVSPLNWDSAIHELRGIDRAITPSMQIHSLVRACKAIQAEFKQAVLPTLKTKGVSDTYLNADTFVPIFIYVFCRSELSTPHLYKDLMWELCHPDQLHGEAGYYLTVFESALEYVEVEPIDEIPHPTRNTTSQQLTSTDVPPEEGIESCDQMPITRPTSKTLDSTDSSTMTSYRTNRSRSIFSMFTGDNKDDDDGSLSVNRMTNEASVESPTTKNRQVSNSRPRRLSLMDRVGMVMGYEKEITLQQTFHDIDEEHDGSVELHKVVSNKTPSF